ncbi:hypothetical protein Slin15195_G111990 [Septoria linicola]|uniref:Uncharacterized protein n=1 Tax=Septoria linicola TaxID=215465 RepID=A0A9Q9B451_9PEZI|nr:hypothetical protein Slin15195_G111990 [Septoria linicola]
MDFLLGLQHNDGKQYDVRKATTSNSARIQMAAWGDSPRKQPPLDSHT